MNRLMTSLAVLAASLLAGCGGDGPPATGNKSNKAADASETPALTISTDDVALMNRLVKQKDAEIRKWSVPGVAQFKLGQDKAQLEDTFVFGLLKYYHQTQFLASPGLVDTGVQQVLLKNEPGLSRWKQRGIQQFWGEYVLMRIKTPLTAAKQAELESEFLMYLDTKYTMRAAVINRRLSAFVAAEEHWRKVMDDWRQWEENKLAREQASRKNREKQIIKNFADWWAAKHIPGL